MVNIMICDDENVILNELKDYVSVCLDKAKIQGEIHTEFNPNLLLHKIKETVYDILLLDIDMPRISGMDIANELLNQKSDTILIFVTNQESLVYDTFKYKPFDFIRKSRYKEDLNNTLCRAFDEINRKGEDLIFKTPTATVRLPYSEIMYFEAEGNYLKIITEKSEYQYRNTMRIVQEQLSEIGFVRIHKGFLVNQAAVHMIFNDKVVLENGQELPIGRTFSESSKTQIMKYLR